MQGTGESKPFSSSAAAAAPPPPPSIGLGIGLGSGSGTTAEKEKEKEKGRRGLARKNLPSPKEMVAHYESQGMHPQEASLKVIDDLQKLLFRVVTTNKKTNSSDAVNSRLQRLESKLDSKPGYPQTLAIGIASGAVFRVLPQVAASVAHIWNSVRASSSTSSS